MGGLKSVIELGDTRPRDREDDLVTAQLKDLDGRVLVENVQCKIYLPRRLGEMPYVEFLASEKQFDALSHHTVVAFHAEHHDAGKLYVELHAKHLFLRNQAKRYWGTDSRSVTVDGVPERLPRTRFLQTEKGAASPTIYFRISNKSAPVSGASADTAP
jgi:hypothetical protein